MLGINTLIHLKLAVGESTALVRTEIDSLYTLSFTFPLPIDAL